MGSLPAPSRGQGARTGGLARANPCFFVQFMLHYLLSLIHISEPTRPY